MRGRQSGVYRRCVTPDHRAQTRAGYDTVADDYARLLPDLWPEAPLDVAMLDDFARRCPATALVLDVGCGAGRVSAHLAAAGLRTLGLDLSPGMVESARRAHPQLRFEVGELTDLPVTDGSAGGVLAWYALIHTAPGELAAIVSELARVTAPGAWLLTAFQAGAGERVERSSAYGHEVSLTSYRHDPAHVAQVLRAGGFDVRAQLHRAAEGMETTPQAVLLARRHGDAGA